MPSNEEKGASDQPSEHLLDLPIKVIFLRGYSFKHIKTLINDPDMPVFLHQTLHEKNVFAQIFITPGIASYIRKHLGSELENNILYSMHKRSIEKTLRMLAV